MKTKTRLFLLIVLILIQFFVPAKMIIDHERILKEGKVYKFKTAPVDPSDPMRGKSIFLNFESRLFYFPKGDSWYSDQAVFVTIDTGTDGYAKITDVSTVEPKNRDYFKAKVDYYSRQDSSYLSLDFPFSTFYMEETKAHDAEITYNNAQKLKKSNCYATVSVLDGSAVIRNVFIDGKQVSE